MTTTQEGAIVRCITRLDELCRDVRNAARVIGNASLFRKMDAASLCIKRYRLRGEHVHDFTSYIVSKLFPYFVSLNLQILYTRIFSSKI